MIEQLAPPTKADTMDSPIFSKLCSAKKPSKRLWNSIKLDSIDFLFSGVFIHKILSQSDIVS